MGVFQYQVLMTIIHTMPEAYGGSIRQELETRLDKSIAIGAVYTTLQRLEDKGWVRSKAGPPLAQRGGRRRKLYELTAEGQTAQHRFERDAQVVKGGHHAPAFS